MNSECQKFVNYIIGKESPKGDKAKLIKDAESKFKLVKDRIIYHTDSFAVRFCFSKSKSSSFSNTVLSLSKLEKYDRIPVFVVLVRKDADNLILLANSSLLKKISHSSKELSMTNIRGSFNGSDIVRKVDDKSNEPTNFDYLFALHQGLDWNYNLSRLVAATSGIKPKSTKAEVNDSVFDSIDRAKEFVSSGYFQELEDDLIERCQKSRDAILVASHIENVNIRGRLIEQLIVADDYQRAELLASVAELERNLPVYDSANGLGDYCRSFGETDTYTDIKTKIIYLGSNPKAYNVDKFLEKMMEDKSVFLFFFVGIDKSSQFRTILCSVYHKELVENTVIQHHWAGRATRGVAQFRGEAIDRMLADDKFSNNIDCPAAREFLKKLIEL